MYRITGKTEQEVFVSSEDLKSLLKSKLGLNSYKLKDGFLCETELTNYHRGEYSWVRSPDQSKLELYKAYELISEKL